ncbi:ETAA1 activator of ATR kinase [Phyllostomus discolor]|uniref:ETAA1 activator of ATR kinase n=1 Tax=Phyllostomus discolor TaxID=89673 RepID=A0A834E6P3_9CHIR|nr:ETAA1 activator of ATR kinase [Phyllostomus discolor]
MRSHILLIVLLLRMKNQQQTLCWVCGLGKLLFLVLLMLQKENQEQKKSAAQS